MKKAERDDPSDSIERLRIFARKIIAVPKRELKEHLIRAKRNGKTRPKK